MTPAQLERYQHFIEFFELLGVSEEDLMNAVALIKGYPELISKANRIILVQKELEKQIERVTRRPTLDEIPSASAVSDFNKESPVLNPYVK